MAGRESSLALRSAQERTARKTISLRAVRIALLGVAFAALATAAQAEVVQQHGLRIGFDARISPKALPREGVAPVAVRFDTRIAAADGTTPPQLRRIRIELNRHGHLDWTGLPRCRLAQIQPSTTRGALRACAGSAVGEGSFSAKVLIAGQAPFPSQGKVHVFNGAFAGRPALLAHVYGTTPVPTSYTVPFAISRSAGAFGTVLTASLPAVVGEAGYITALSMTLRRRFNEGGQRRSYLRAGCPAPVGLGSVVFPLARARLYFAGGRSLGGTLIRGCTVRR